MSREAPALALLTGLLALIPGSTQAGNTVHPRTPVLWPEAPCIQTVDRAVDPSFAFTYEIPAEDTNLSIDELDDSRRHQFLGFCRQWPAGSPPPRYVSLADLQRSVDAGFEAAVALEDPESTLETSAVWADCWARITADDARRPITFEAAAAPVVWDTGALAAGTWLIAGYTWEPPFNIWRRAPWVLRVVDGADLAAQAAVSMADTNDYLYLDETLDLPICVDAAPGSTLSLEWADSKPDLLEWQGVEELALDGPAELLLPFAPPPETAGQTILLRAAVAQPDAPGYVGHALGPVIVFTGGDGDPGDGDPGDGDGDPGDGDPGDPGDGDPDDADTGDTGPGASEGGGGCSIAATPPALPWLALPVLLLPCLIRRRSRP